ncbi:MAG: hypothetical protein AAGD22_02060 [Verrucomicrobiota bacterium]
MNSPFLVFCCRVAAAFGLVVVPLTASAFTSLSIVDDFQSDSHNLDLSGSTGSVSDSSSSAPTVIGGHRQIRFSVTSNPFGNPARTLLNNAGDGQLSMTLGDDAIGLTRLVYQGPGAAGLGGLDFTEAGHNSVILYFLSIDETIRVDLTISDASGRTATLNTNLGPTPGPNSFSFVYSLFDNAPNTDFTQVDTLAIQLAAITPGAEFHADAIALGNSPLAAAPEPDRAILLAVAALTLFGRRRRHPLSRL